MLGLIYTSASDFSAFSYPRAPFTSEICHDVHESAIEERYCPKEHLRDCDDQRWDEILRLGIQAFEDHGENAVHQDQLEASPEPHVHFSFPEGSPFFETPPLTPSVSIFSTPSLVASGEENEDCYSSDSDYEFVDTEAQEEERLNAAKATTSSSGAVTTSRGKKRKRGRSSKSYAPARKRLVVSRASSSNSVATISSIGTTTSSLAHGLPTPISSPENPWKCPHCPWIQHTQRLPDFLRHQRSHFVSQSDWPCPNPKCGKGFARKDSLKRHLDNRSTGCKRPAGYTVC